MCYYSTHSANYVKNRNLVCVHELFRVRTLSIWLQLVLVARTMLELRESDSRSDHQILTNLNYKIMTILEYYEGLARCKRSVNHADTPKVHTPASVDELRHKYYVVNCVLKSKGKDRKRKEYRVELREGMTRGMYERELRELFPTHYALTVVLPELRDMFPYCFENKTQYYKQLKKVKKQYELTNAQLKPFAV